MSTTLIDTSLIIRLLINDDPIQSKKAAAFFEKAEAEDKKLFLDNLVLAEIVFVLTAYYKRSRDYVAGTMLKFINNPLIQTENPKITRAALENFAKSEAHFVDCYLAASASINGYKLASFDNDFMKM